MNTWLQENPGKKMLSTYAINNSLSAPKDWDAIAEKCSNNPNHEHFGKPVEEIRLLWSTKSKKGMSSGNTLDDYITAKFENRTIDISNFDMNLLAKSKGVDDLHASLSTVATYVGNEIWLTSYKLGISVRCDALFIMNSTKNPTIMIAEWKGNNAPSMSDKWNKLIGPAEGFDDCDIVKFTIQTHIYKFIFEEYGFEFNIASRIFNFREDKCHILKEAFPYDSSFIANIAEWARAKQ